MFLGAPTPRVKRFSNSSHQFVTGCSMEAVGIATSRPVDQPAYYRKQFTGDRQARKKGVIQSAPREGFGMPSRQDLLLNAVMRRLKRAPCTPLGEIARELHVSTRTLQNVVKLGTGETFRKVRDELLVGRVKTLLEADPSRPIKDLSYELGYKSPRSFARAVKQGCGFSPEQLRSRIIFDVLQTVC